jgi:GT2 family glycosyltransferase
LARDQSRICDINHPLGDDRPTMTSCSMPKVYVCVLSWNKCEDTLSCVKSVLDQDFENLRVVVVDNASTDGSVAALREMGGSIDFIELRDNVGFTGGCNAGIRHALAYGADYVWLLNNDSHCTPEALSALVAHAESRPDVGMVSPIITDRRSGRDEYVVGRLDLSTGAMEETVDPVEAESMQRRFPNQIFLKGTALLIKRRVIEQIGLLDEHFFAYCEDLDFCIRAAAAGYRAECVTSVRVYHDQGPSIPGQPWRKPYAFYYAVRNGILFWRKYARGIARWRYARWHACTIFRVLARGGFGREETGAFADGLWSGFRGATGKWDPSLSAHRMPGALRGAIVANPAFWLAMIEAKPVAALRAVRHPNG